MTYSNLRSAILLTVLAFQVVHATTLSVDDGRPVAKAVQTLVSQYGYAITYEDPRYAYDGDLQDVTTQVRKDLDKYPPGKAPKVIAPLGGKLTLNVPSTMGLSDVSSVLNQLVQSSPSGHFRVQQTGDVFHVVPTEVRDRDGNWALSSSILDVPISIPTKDRSESEIMDAICQAVSSIVQVEVDVSGIRVGGFRSEAGPTLYRFGADNELARSVLMRALATTSNNKRTWLIFYDVGQKLYVLNIFRVPELFPKPQVPVPPPAVPNTSGVSGIVNPLPKNPSTK